MENLQQKTSGETKNKTGGHGPEGHITDMLEYKDGGDKQKTEKNRGIF